MPLVGLKKLVFPPLIRIEILKKEMQDIMSLIRLIGMLKKWREKSDVFLDNGGIVCNSPVGHETGLGVDNYIRNVRLQPVGNELRDDFVVGVTKSNMSEVLEVCSIPTLWNEAKISKILVQLDTFSDKGIRRLDFPASSDTIMDQRLLVDSVTKETTDWTCKVQEQQVSIVIYDEDIPRYDNLFLLFHTYLVSCAKVRDPRSYSIRAGTYGWVADKFTIVEPIIDNDGLEAPLPAPEKLSTLLFSAIEQQHPGVEFVVVNCSALQYTADQSKHFREAIVIDQSSEIGNKISNNNFTKSSIREGNYPDELGEAERTNVVIYFSSSTSSLNLAPIEDQVQSVSTIPESLSTVQTVHVEGRISLPDHSQSFYLLGCSHCNQDVRPKTKKNGPLLQLYTTSAIGPQLYLFPFRCHFNIDITDFSGTITTTMSEALAERILSLTANQIYDKVAVQKQPLSIAGINRQDRKLFKLQLQTSAFRFPDQKADALAVASFTETEQTALSTSSDGIACTDALCFPIPASV
ncbi:hypothetical protein BC332_01952 [Capsicum chinense]|nr:hypothetical protein BC332_01952 [Capsicum chinense]